MTTSPIIWLEGPIAAGKTTMARRLGQLLGFDVLEEPVDANPYLAMFYQDPGRWAFSMQIYLLHYRYSMKQEAVFRAARNGTPGIILDRSIAGDRVFAKLHLQAGNIAELDWKTYEFCYNIMACSIQMPTLFLYLDVQPETCMRRMHQRGRDCEVTVSVDYLRELREGYARLLKELQRGQNPWNHSIRVERIAWDVDTRSDAEWEALSKTVLEACQQ